MAARFETGRDVDYPSRLSLPAGDRSAPEFVTKYMLAYTNGANGDLKSSPASESANISLNKNNEISKSISTEAQTDPGTGEGNQLSLNYLSPELQDRAVELLRTDSNSVEVRNLKNLFIEAISESPDLKPFDESSVVEGESQVDTLQRQVDDAREYINALSKELEEERNASAIAANQAMAMITRLQEEKAALRIEALQYLRMMEEQAEYDVEALDKANDLLTEKEREIQDLEADLEYYRLNFPDEIPEPEQTGPVNLDKEQGLTMNTTTTCSKTEPPEANNISESGFPEACLVDDQPVVITAWSEIEDEKLYISHLLQKLEKKLNRLAQYGASQHNSDSDHSDNEKNRKRERRASFAVNGTRPSLENDDTVSDDDDDDDEDSRENGLEDLENEILELNERLEALEADCSFLQRSLNSLKNGKEGLVLIQEILHLLREVKKIGLKTMDDPSVL
ncbi:hypothetical protein HRI_003541100 [Hibiscus trionum]|uniref:GTD-binding domain-containing protein n=1 Tax=Hibiscus trionum TaxID=183268 RepID=A0A9W7MG18_HIBTR|nr:hypothetical protein HRI_003541100 [Hibiscus trionum]